VVELLPKEKLWLFSKNRGRVVGMVGVSSTQTSGGGRGGLEETLKEVIERYKR